MCRETANKISCIKTSIRFIKEGNVSKTPHKNRHKPTLLNGCTNCRVIADVDRQLAFITEITSTRQCPDLVIWSVNSKKVIIAELMIPFERSVLQSFPLSPLLYVLALELLLRRLRDEGANLARYGLPFVCHLTSRVSAFADDITVFESRHLDIEALNKAVAEYERIAGAKVNFDKSEGLRHSACMGSDTLPGPFNWSDGPVCILVVWFGPDLQLERNWSEV